MLPWLMGSPLPSSGLYAAMQAGSLDACTTSSTSLISFRLHEVSKAVTTGRTGSFWFMFEPLLMSKQVFEGLPDAQQQAIVHVGAELEAFAVQAARQDDEEVARVFGQAGLQVRDMDAAVLARWRDLARATAWKEFAERNAACAHLLKLAEAVAA